MGDLVLTCTGDLSRNRQVGLRLAQGQKLLDILAEMKMVAEGVKTTEAVNTLRQKLDVEMPITEQVYAILYQGKDPSQAVRDLMVRKTCSPMARLEVSASTGLPSSPRRNPARAASSVSTAARASSGISRNTPPSRSTA